MYCWSSHSHVIIGTHGLKTSGSGPVSAAAGAVLAPMQKGVNQLGSGLTNLREHLRTKKEVWKKKMKNFGHSWQEHGNPPSGTVESGKLDNLKSV